MVRLITGDPIGISGVKDDLVLPHSDWIDEFSRLVSGWVIKSGCIGLICYFPDDRELDANVTHRVQSWWKKWKRVYEVIGERTMNVKIKEKVYRTVVRQTRM